MEYVNSYFAESWDSQPKKKKIAYWLLVTHLSRIHLYWEKQTSVLPKLFAHGGILILIVISDRFFFPCNWTKSSQRGTGALFVIINQSPSLRMLGLLQVGWNFYQWQKCIRSIWKFPSLSFPEGGITSIIFLFYLLTKVYFPKNLFPYRVLLLVWCSVYHSLIWLIML